MPDVRTTGDGRPKAPEPPERRRRKPTIRGSRVHLRCTVAEETKWQASASRAGMDLSEWIRRHLGKAAEAEANGLGQDAPEVDLIDMTAARSSINSAAHELDMYPGHQRTPYIAAHLKTARERLTTAIERAFARSRR